MIPNWVLRDSDLSKNELLVYIALLGRADQAGYAFPSIATIAKESRISARTVQATLANLIARGLITKQVRPRDKARHNSNLYHIKVFDRAKPTNMIGSAREGRTHRVQASLGEGAEAADEVEPLQVDSRQVELTVIDHPDQAAGASFRLPTLGITAQQLAFLSDLHIHYSAAPPTPTRTSQWSALTQDQARGLIQKYLRVMPRHSEYAGPEEGDEAYSALSPQGREWADARFVPESGRPGNL